MMAWLFLLCVCILTNARSLLARDLTVIAASLSNWADSISSLSFIAFYSLSFSVADAVVLLGVAYCLGSAHAESGGTRLREAFIVCPFLTVWIAPLNASIASWSYLVLCWWMCVMPGKFASL